MHSLYLQYLKRPTKRDKRKYVKQPCAANRDVKTGGKGGAIPRAPNHYGDAESLWGRRITAGSLKRSSNVASTFFNTVHLFSKDFRFEHGGAKLASCPGRHLTSLRTWRQRPYVFIRNSFVLWQPCAHGRRKGGQKGLAPLDLYIVAKKFVFLVSSGKKTNFTTFGPLRKNFWKNPLVPPLLEKILPTPSVLQIPYTCRGTA